MKHRFIAVVVLALAVSMFASGCSSGGGGENASPTLTYTVTYDGNGNTDGTVPIDPAKYKEGETVGVLGNSGELAKSDYAFTGWNTKADGSGMSYFGNGGEAFTMGSANVVLYAKWILADATITGTISLPGAITADGCYAVGVTTSYDSPAIAGAFGFAANGASSISYAMSNVPSGQYYLYAMVVFDSSGLTPPPDCTPTSFVMPKAGDYMGAYGGEYPGTKITVNAGENIYDLNLSMIP